ncbi:MAG: 5'/3'-nucleotidase SurE [Rhodobacteraceae bacterium]|nr:5'/3'-nucleotidase SurE [Paracoccaceae bacterium]
MRILITNDDGISAPGLEIMHDIACELAGAENVWTVAPAFEQSGVAHCISYTKPMLITQLAERRFAVDGSPADCVLAGIYDVMQDAPPDVVLSGVNKGNNAAENTLYSGTVGAVIEAAMHQTKGIALSQYYGPRNLDLEDSFEPSVAFGARTVRDLLDNAPWHDGPYELFYNVNFPPCPAAEVKGTRATTQGWRANTNFAIEPHIAPNKRKYLWIKGGPQHHPTEPGSDAHANLHDYVSVTPMRADLTAHGSVPALRKVFT